jgi:hypothetical protein
MNMRHAICRVVFGRSNGTKMRSSARNRVVVVRCECDVRIERANSAPHGEEARSAVSNHEMASL